MKTDNSPANSAQTLIDYLKANNIGFESFEHPPVFTCEEAAIHLQHVPGVPTKNLFLVDVASHQYFLVSVSESKRVDLKALATLLECRKLSFASAEELLSMLGVTPGSVTLLAVVNDRDHKVRVFVDREVWSSPFVQSHPLVNTKTLTLSPAGIQSLCNLTGHKVEVIDVPAK